jgi:hypothetical protein
VIVGASGSSARSELDIPRRRAVSETAIIDVEPIEKRKRNIRLKRRKRILGPTLVESFVQKFSFKMNILR